MDEVGCSDFLILVEKVCSEGKIETLVAIFHILGIIMIISIIKMIIMMIIMLMMIIIMMIMIILMKSNLCSHKLSATHLVSLLEHHLNKTKSLSSSLSRSNISDIVNVIIILIVIIIVIINLIIVTIIIIKIIIFVMELRPQPYLPRVSSPWQICRHKDQPERSENDCHHLH